VVEIEGIRKSFGEHEVLLGVNLLVRPGETMVILGRSGCGKSVLLKLVIGLLKPEAGEIRVGGEPVRYDRPEDLFRMRRRFGMLFQGAALFDSLTVGENVGLALREHTDLTRDEVATRVREKLLMVGLARAMAMDPEYVLYDEPTTGLDPVMGDVINDLIRDLQRRTQATSLAVTHDIHSAFRIGDRIALLQEGRIIHVGTVDETRRSENPDVQQFIGHGNGGREEVFPQG